MRVDNVFVAESKENRVALSVDLPDRHNPCCAFPASPTSSHPYITHHFNFLSLVEKMTVSPATFTLSTLSPSGTFPRLLGSSLSRIFYNEIEPSSLRRFPPDSKQLKRVVQVG